MTLDDLMDEAMRLAEMSPGMRALHFALEASEKEDLFFFQSQYEEEREGAAALRQDLDAAEDAETLLRNGLVALRDKLKNSKSDRVLRDDMLEDLDDLINAS